LCEIGQNDKKGRFWAKPGKNVPRSRLGFRERISLVTSPKPALSYVTKVICSRSQGSSYNRYSQFFRWFAANMAENRVEETIRNAVEQVLQRQLSSLRESVVQEVLREIGPALSSKSGHAGGGGAALQKAVSVIQAGTNQKEILRALLDNTVLYSGRAALFVMKNGSASGWQGIAFQHNDSIKDFLLDMDAGLLSAVLQSRVAEAGSASDFDHSFIKKFGVPSDGRAVVLPLLLRDKISALVYADAGDGSNLDADALDVLVRATSTWLEVISQRRQAQKDGGSEAPELSHAAPSTNDPFAAHSPIHSAKAQHGTESAQAMSAAAGWGGTTTVPSGEDAEVHRKAQRFARLLIDEIKLYNQAKVTEGRKHKDLYDRLKEDIEKSRVTYQKRYGNTAAASADYFSQELIRSLAEDDASLMGNNFRR
jgi:hypothetical protein